MKNIFIALLFVTAQAFAASPIIFNASCPSGAYNLAAQACLSTGGGGVTSVTATAPLSSSGGATPDISMAQATSSVSGYLTSTDWATFNGKQDTLVAADATHNGYLTSTDWSTFNGKFTPGTVTKFVVDNGQYATGQDAIDAASAGDTLIFGPKTGGWGNVIIKPRVNIFGMDGPNNRTILFGSLTFSPTSGTATDNTNFVSNVQFTAPSGSSTVVIGGTAPVRVRFYGCVFVKSDAGVQDVVSVTNGVATGSVYMVNSTISGGASTGSAVDTSSPFFKGQYVEIGGAARAWNQTAGMSSLDKMDIEYAQTAAAMNVAAGATLAINGSLIRNLGTNSIGISTATGSILTMDQMLFDVSAGTGYAVSGTGTILHAGATFANVPIVNPRNTSIQGTATLAQYDSLIGRLDAKGTIKAVTGQIEIGTVDPYSRGQIWNKMANASLRLGSLGQDGDPTDVSSEGIVSYGANAQGEAISSALGNFGYARIKPMRFGLYNSHLNSADYIFRTDETSLYFKDNSYTKTFEIARATGNTMVGGTIQVKGGSPGVGKVLTSDAVGLASWQSASAPATIWKDGAYMATGDADLYAAANGTALSTLMPFSDDSQSQFVIGDMSAGMNLLSLNSSGAGAKLFTIYDDGGTLKVTQSGMTQPAYYSTYLIQNDLYGGSNDDTESLAVYTMVDTGGGDPFGFRVGSGAWNFATGIPLSGTYAASAGTVAQGDSVETAISKIVGNMNAESQVLHSATINLTAAQMAAMSFDVDTGIPGGTVQIVAGTTGKVILPVGVSVRYNYSTAFTVLHDGRSAFWHSSVAAAGGSPHFQNFTNVTGFLDQTANMGAMTTQSGTALSLSVAGDALYYGIWCWEDAAAFVSGGTGSTVDVTVYYYLM